MTWLILALAAHVGNALVFVVDKSLLGQQSAIGRPARYAAYSGLVAGLAALLLFFSPASPNWFIVFWSGVSGILWVAALWCFFIALKKGEPSRIVPITGSTVPICTLIFAAVALGETLTFRQGIAVVLLITGGILLSIRVRGKKSSSKIALVAAIAGGALFAAHFAIVDFVYEHFDPFLAAFAYTRIGVGIAGGILLIFAGGIKKQKVKTTGWVIPVAFFGSKALGMLALLAQNKAIELGSVTVVNALQGVQYVAVLALAVVVSKWAPTLFHEEIHRVTLLQKIIGIAGISIGIALLLFAPAVSSPPIQFGVTFSKPHAEGIGLDWKQTYQAILDDLGVKQLRLSAYWNEIEPEDDTYDFTDLDYQMNEAATRDAMVVLAIGHKLPRWPECHEPHWVIGKHEPAVQEEVLEMLGVVVNRYKNHPALAMWQLENEPFLDFGTCTREEVENFLAQEESLLRSLDENHPILITDSGELNWWITSSRFGDVLGTTMYRTVFSGRTQDLFHYDYIFPAWLYRLKSRYVKILRGKEVIISELQGEPWGALPFPDMSDEEIRASFSPDRFRALARFAERTQLPIAYWWGVEFWYWEKQKHDNPAYWEIAQEMFYTNK